MDLNIVVDGKRHQMKLNPRKLGKSNDEIVQEILAFRKTVSTKDRDRYVDFLNWEEESFLK